MANELRREIAADRVTSDGRRVVVAVCLDANGNVWVESSLNGERIAKTFGLGVLQAPKSHPSGQITHYAGSGKSAIAVFAAEAARVESLQTELRAYFTATPEGLVAARRRLCEDVNIALQIEREDRDAAWGREDERGAMESSGKVAAAQHALAAFDAAHPEVKSQLDAAAESRRAAELADQISYRGE